MNRNQAPYTCRRCGRDIRPDPQGAPAWLDTDDTSYMCPGTGEDFTGTWHIPGDTEPEGSWEDSRLGAMAKLLEAVEAALYQWPTDGEATHVQIEDAITAYRLSKESWSQKQQRRDQQRKENT